MKRNYFVAAITILIGAQSSGVNSLEAKPRGKSPLKQSSAAVVSKEAVAHIRVWKVSENSASPAVQVSIASAGSARSLGKISLKEGRYDFASFIDVPPGLLDLQISEATGDAQSSHKILVAIQDGHSATLLLRQEKSGGVVTDLMDEGTGTSGDLSIYNFLDAGGGDCQVMIGDNVNVLVSANRGFFRIVGLNRQNYLVTTSFKGAEGKSSHWENSVDFHQLQKASIVIYPDSYGRTRPRLIVDNDNVANNPQH